MTTEPDLSRLDPGIRPIVTALRAHDVETFSSCEGGPGHAYSEPTVAFHGVYAEGLRAVAVAIALMLPVKDLRRVWRVSSRDELEGPIWEMTFSRFHNASSAAPPVLAPPNSDTKGTAVSPSAWAAVLVGYSIPVRAFSK